MYITQSLHRALQQTPHRPHTIYQDRVRTVAEHVDRVARFAAGLQALGVAKDDRVGIMALNSDRYLEFLRAVPWADAVVNPVNIRWSPAEVAYSLVDCDTRVLVVDDAFAGVVAAIREQAPNLAQVIYCGEGDTPEGMVGYEDLISDHEPVEDCRRGGDALFGVFYTGGTTGHPKGVMASHQSFMTSSYAILGSQHAVTTGGVLLNAGPLFHVAALGMWMVGTLAQSANVVIPVFTPAATIEAIEKHRVTDCLLVPTMIQMLVDSPDAADADVSSLRHLVYGASVISEAVLERARKFFVGTEFTQAYGMTELAPLAALLSPTDHEDPTLLRAAGRAGSCVEIRIVDTEDREVPRGAVGEITVRGDNVMTGYWNQPELTASTLRGGWMHTGDAGYMDERGYVFIVDRVKDMIVTGGENVYSAEVENALAKHEAVATCAVIGVPDESWGERVHAVVVLKSGVTVDEGELIDFCRSYIANYKIPRSVAIVDALPVSGAGKILKRELREQFWGHLERSVN